MISIQYRIAEEDFMAAAALVLRKKNGALVYMQVIGSLVLVYFLYLILQGRISLRSWPGAVLPLFLTLLPFFTRHQFRKVYRSSPSLQEPRSLVADETGLEFQSQSSNGHVAWSNYISFIEDKRSFALMQQGKQIFVPVPKRELTAAQCDELRSLFERHIPRK